LRQAIFFTGFNSSKIPMRFHFRTLNPSGTQTLFVLFGWLLFGFSLPLHAQTSCIPPSQVVVGNRSLSTAIVRWNAIPDALTYQVSFRQQGQTRWQTRGTDADSILLTGLVSDQVYEVRIATQCATDISGFSDTLEFRKTRINANTICANNTYQWVEISDETAARSIVNDVTFDRSGNLYVIGARENAPKGTAQSYVAKLNSKGELIWQTFSQGTGNQEFARLKLDSRGNVYVAGWFDGQIQLGSKTASASNGTDAFLAQLDNNGTWQWLRNEGGAGNDSITALAVDGSDNIYVSGSFEQLLPIGNANLVSLGESDHFLARYGTDGVPRWAVRVGGKKEDIRPTITVGSDGNIYLAGGFQDTLRFSPTLRLVSAGRFDLYVANYSPSGSLNWARRAGGIGNEYPHALLGLADNSLMISGGFTGADARFGSVRLSSAGGTDLFVARMRVDGQYTWVKSAGGSSDDFLISSIVEDGRNNLYLVGNSNTGAEPARFFGETVPIQIGSNDGLIAQFTTAGDLLSLRPFGGIIDDLPTAIAVDRGGNVAMTGAISPAAIFDNISLVGNGQINGFVAYISCSDVNCFAPFPVTITNITRGTAVVSWTPTAPAEAYRVEYRPQGSATWLVLRVSQPTTEITGLVGNTPYEIRVNATCNDRTTDDAPILNFNTLSTGACSAPARVQVIDQTTESLIIRWDNVFGTTRYLVEYRPVGDQFWRFQHQFTNIDTLIALREGTDYEIRVRSLCLQERSEAAPTIIGRTATTPRCEPPTNVQATVLSAYRVQINFDAMPLAGRYVLQYRRFRATGPVAEWVTLRLRNNEAIIGGLTQDTEYEVQVFTVCNSIQTPNASPLVRFRTQPETGCVCPQTMLIRTRPTQATLTWPTSTFADAYEVAYRNYPIGQCAGLYSRDTTTETRFVINNLVPNQVYHVIVRSICDGQLSENCITRLFETRIRRDGELVLESGPSVALFPNPNAGDFQLFWAAENASQVNIQVIDALGRVVHQQNESITAGEQYLPIRLDDSVAAGVYWVKWDAGHDSDIIKLVLQR
jgi:hypothetical protein